MAFFYEFEILGGIIPNFRGLVFFCEIIIYFGQTRKAKVRQRKKVSPHK